VLTTLVLALSLSSLHPDSLSTSRIEISGNEAHLYLRCQALSLMEVIEGLDSNADEEISAEEVQAKGDLILNYVGEHYQVFTGSDREYEGGTRLAFHPIRVGFIADSPDRATGFRKGAVDVEISFQASESIRDISVEMSLFLETSPAHLDYTTVKWESGLSTTQVLKASQPNMRIDPEGKGVIRAFVGIGCGHILSGWDHIAFLVALILSARRIRSLLAVVTAFTVAHSITLALSALDMVNIAAYTQLVEVAVALSIAYVAIDNLFHPKLDRARWIEAFLFGLLHGLAFASFLGMSLASETAKGTALISFNAGVELGQVLIVIFIALLLRLLPRRNDEADPFLAPLWLRRGGSVAIAAAGLYWFSKSW
jgi:hypothetical protein